MGQTSAKSKAENIKCDSQTRPYLGLFKVKQKREVRVRVDFLVF